MYNVHCTWIVCVFDFQAFQACIYVYNRIEFVILRFSYILFFECELFFSLFFYLFIEIFDRLMKWIHKKQRKQIKIPLGEFDFFCYVFSLVVHSFSTCRMGWVREKLSHVKVLFIFDVRWLSHDIPTHKSVVILKWSAQHSPVPIDPHATCIWLFLESAFREQFHLHTNKQTHQPKNRLATSYRIILGFRFAAHSFHCSSNKRDGNIHFHMWNMKRSNCWMCNEHTKAERTNSRKMRLKFRKFGPVCTSISRECNVFYQLCIVSSSLCLSVCYFYPENLKIIILPHFKLDYA